MQKRILVTYASRNGSTAKVANDIAQILSEENVQVEVMHMKEVKDLTVYDAVVAGSAIQAGKWLPEAMQFIQIHKAVLNRKPFAAFLVCMTLAMPNSDKYLKGVAEWLEPVRTQVKPFSEGLFAGTLDIKKVPSFRDRLKFRISVGFGIWREGDHINREAIQTWALGLKPVLFA